MKIAGSDALERATRGRGRGSGERRGGSGQPAASFRSRDVALPPRFRFWSIVLPVSTACSVLVECECQCDNSAIHRASL